MLNTVLRGGCLVLGKIPIIVVTAVCCVPASPLTNVLVKYRPKQKMRKRIFRPEGATQQLGVVRGSVFAY